MTSKRKTALALVLYVGSMALASGLVVLQPGWLHIVLAMLGAGVGTYLFLSCYIRKSGMASDHNGGPNIP